MRGTCLELHITFREKRKGVRFRGRRQEIVEEVKEVRE
jgi:hypothetical protein